MITPKPAEYDESYVRQFVADANNDDMYLDPQVEIFLEDAWNAAYKHAQVLYIEGQLNAALQSRTQFVHSNGRDEFIAENGEYIATLTRELEALRGNV